jgi:hypothetical protein
MAARRFPPSWSVEAACFVVRDHNGQQLHMSIFEDESGRRSAGTNNLIEAFSMHVRVSPA